MAVEFEDNDDSYAVVDGKRALTTYQLGSNPPVNAPLALLRPASDNGLPSGNFNMVGDYSTTNKEFYVEALPGERLSVRRAIIHLFVSATTITAETYGNVPLLTNGILLFQEYKGIILNALDGLPIKKQEDWGRLCYDSRPVGPYGAAGNQFKFWQARFSFDRFVDPTYGIILEEGERLGVRLRDDFTAAGANPLLEHYIYFQGKHLGTPNPIWQNPISPLPST